MQRPNKGDICRWAAGPVILARAQFAFTVSFHFIFPAFTTAMVAARSTLVPPERPLESRRPEDFSMAMWMAAISDKWGPGAIDPALVDEILSLGHRISKVRSRRRKAVR